VHRRIFKSIVLTSFGVLSVIPASADIRANLGSLHIRIATDAPPPVRVERRPTRPDRDSVWIKGYWDRQGDQWAWVSGRWEQPPDRHQRWVEAHYRREGEAWRYEPGHWSQQQLVEDDDYRHWRDEHRH
jgi:WXXGXW repeat (2 copies)